MGSSVLQSAPTAPTNRRSWFNFILLTLALSLLYLLLAGVSFFFSATPGSLPAIWLPSGLAVAALLLDRRRAWKQVLAAIFIGGVISNLVGGMPLLVSLGYGAADCVESALLVWLLFRGLPADPNFERLRDLLIFFAYSLACLGVTSLFGTLIRVLAFHASPWQAWLEWVMTDWLGMILFTPLILVWGAKPGRRSARWREGLLLIFSLVLVTGLVFFSTNAQISDLPLGSYVFFAFFIWAALRFDQRMSASLLPLVGLAVLLGTSQGLGEFAYPAVEPASRILSAQVFIAILTFTSLVLSALLTERRRAEERYKSQFMNLPLASFTWQRRADDFILIDYNEAALAFTKGRISSMTGMSARQIYPQRPEVLEDLQKCFSTQAVVQRGPHWDLFAIGEMRDLNISYEYVAPDLVVGHVEDISERMRAEQDMKRLAAVVESSDDAIISRTRDEETILTWNAGAERLYGYSAAEAIGQPISILLPPDRTDNIEAAHARIRVGEHVGTFETERRAKDGHLLDVALTISPITDATGQVTGASSIARDISERKMFEKALRDSERRYRSLFENASLAVLQVTPDGCPLSVNPEFLRMFGYDSWKDFSAQVKNTAQLFVDSQRRDQILRERAADPQAGHFESLYLRKEGSTFMGQLTLQAVTDAAGQVQYFDGFIENITQRKHFEEALRANEALYHAMFEATSAVKLIIEPPSGAIVRANLSAAAFYGYPVEELERMNINQLNTLPQEQTKLEMLAAAEQSRSYFNFQHRLASGELRDVEVYSSPLEMGGRSLLHSIIHDVTERKRTERIQLARSRLLQFSQDHSLAELLTATIDEAENLTGSRIGFYHLIEPDQITISAYNWSTRTAQEYCRAENSVSHSPIGKAGVWADAVRQRQPVIHNDYNALLADQRNGLPDGHAALMREMVVPVLRGGRVVCILGIGNKEKVYSDEDVQVVSQMADLAWDIAERKRAEEALAYSRRLLNDSQAIARVGGWEYDLATRQLAWTEEVFEIYGLDHHANPGEVSEAVASYAPEDRPLIEQAFQRALETGQPYDLELRFDNALGQRLWVRTNARAVYREGGMLKLTGTIMDITERKQAELALRAARDELEERVNERTSDLLAVNAALEKALLARDEFLAAISHELRTPLAGVLGLAQVLQMQTYGPLTEKQVFALKNIEISGQRLLELINDILDFSLAQSGALTLNLAPCSLVEICQDCLKVAAVEAAKKEQTVHFNSSPASIMLHADGRWVARTIRHLLGNASKFTANGGSYGIELTGDAAAGEVNLTVWDTGIGILPENLPRLFQPFVQLDGRLQRQYNGTGLGLALVKQLVDLHGGRISVESDYGHGSRFTVTLPWLQENG